MKDHGLAVLGGGFLGALLALIFAFPFNILSWPNTGALIVSGAVSGAIGFGFASVLAPLQRWQHFLILFCAGAAGGLTFWALRPKEAPLAMATLVGALGLPFLYFIQTVSDRPRTNPK